MIVMILQLLPLGTLRGIRSVTDTCVFANVHQHVDTD